MKWVLCAVWLLTGLLLTEITTARPFPRRAHRILFLGNSITYAGTYVADIEAYLLAKYPKLTYEFINVGLPSETVSGLSEPNHANGRFPRPDLHERLDRVLTQTRPDVVFACYGMNDGIYLPLDESRFRAYREGMKWLHTELKKAGARQIVFLTPPVHDDPQLGLNGYNRTLDRYSEWLLAQKDTLAWEVADVHFPMVRFLENKRQSDPSFKLAADGVHPGELGHWLMARAVLGYLGEKVADEPTAQAALEKVASAKNVRADEIRRLVGQRQGVMKDAWLRATGHKRPEMAVGKPMPEARTLYNELERQIRAVRVAKKGRP
ncbi:SGNH/GDSL hydrolase family protein [Rudanella lutea]|uniref:SGNH/GDSL hydrolase family protein n=1 Tax=Rudanella lutea TaxID=451374 RepID=UPI0003716458|nr:SGNH/GDSL hydrolase family protein [Rudanella lutea]